MLELALIIALIIAAVAFLVGRVESGVSDESRETNRFLFALDGWIVRPRGRRRAAWLGYEALIAGVILVIGLGVLVLVLR